MKIFKYSLLVTILCAAVSYADGGSVFDPPPPIRVAIIDTGLDPTEVEGVKVCEDGSYDYGLQRSGVGRDIIGHGTSVARIITEFAYKEANYCIMAYNVHVPFLGSPMGTIPAGALAHSVKRAVDEGAKIINISLIGTEYSINEYEAIKYASSKGVWVFVAAGNDNVDLDDVCHRYPVCYKGIRRMVRVGATDIFRNRASYSNFGEIIDRWEIGSFPQVGVYGTSFATPVAVAKVVNYVDSKRKEK